MDIQFGVDYYPEHWSRERWEIDVRLMEEMGIQVVRLAEFAWHKLEPTEGCYDFEWLDSIIRLLEGHGIKTVLGTPTAAPPAWMIKKHPEIQPVDKYSRVRHFGGRHHDCQSNKTYREYIRSFTEEYSKHYASDPAVIGWQIDNELGTYFDESCMCASCTQRYREWLKEKYKDIDALNKAWGTAFWSQGYNDFEEITPPLLTATGENPSAMLDWKRFASDLIVDFAKLQADIIRKNCPGQFITHNYMNLADRVDYYELGKLLDFVSDDIYPAGSWQKQPHQPEHEMAACYDAVRGYKKKNFWMMEQQAGMAGWNTMGRAPAPGEISAWAVQAMAHGADAIVFFRWRACALGTEQYWHGILGHSGNPGRVYEEIRSLIGRFSPVMKEIKGSMPKPEAAMVHSFEQNWAIEIQPNHPDLDYIGHLMGMYKPLYDRNIQVDIVRGTDDLSRYRLVIAPLQYLMTKEIADNYRNYVNQGGNLVLDMRAGVKDGHNICMTEYELPGELRDICGIEIPEYDCLFEKEGKAEYNEEVYDISKWADIIELKGAEPLASFACGFYEGSPVVTVNQYGMGRVWYIGTEGSPEFLDALFEDILSESGVAGIGESPEGVELSIREKNGKRWLFAINFTGEEKRFKLSGTWRMVLGEREKKLQPYETQVYINELGAAEDKAEISMMQELLGMSSKELFIVLTEGRDVLLRAKLQDILKAHLKYYGKDSFNEEEENVDLSLIVGEYYDGKYKGR